MTPRQARVALGAFLLLAAGVTGNALFLQGAMPPKNAVRKGSVAHGPGKPERRIAAPATERPSIAALLKTRPAGAEIEAPPDEADSEAVLSIQRELERRGYGPLIADGTMRPAVRAAIMAFEYDQRLPLTGEATQALLKRLVFGAPAAAEPAAALEVRSPHAQALVKEVQRQLAAHGYRPGAVDGRLGPETVAAIRVFETDHGLAPTGRISAGIVTRLQEGTAGANGHKRR